MEVAIEWNSFAVREMSGFVYEQVYNAMFEVLCKKMSSTCGFWQCLMIFKKRLLVFLMTSFYEVRFLSTNVIGRNVSTSGSLFSIRSAVNDLTRVVCCGVKSRKK